MRLFEESAEPISLLYVLPIYKRNPILKNSVWPNGRTLNTVNAKFASGQTSDQLREILRQGFELLQKLFIASVANEESKLRRALYKRRGLFGVCF